LCKKNPNSSSLYINLGICYGTIKKYPQAIAAFTEALKQDKQNPNIYMYLATAYKFNGDSLNCNKTYQLGLILDPSLPRP
jgi:predicted Zn-dependent protease